MAVKRRSTNSRRQEVADYALGTASDITSQVTSFTRLLVLKSLTDVTTHLGTSNAGVLRNDPHSPGIHSYGELVETYHRPGIEVVALVEPKEVLVGVSPVSELSPSLQQHTVSPQAIHIAELIATMSDRDRAYIAGDLIRPSLGA
ncbi:MAG TPA: hypothetical protein VIH90_02790 [Candidatus Saccharimonadales bacterium]